jgi:hypothetical protein
MQRFAHGMTAAHELQLPVIGLEGPSKLQQCANAAQSDEVELLKVDGQGLGVRMKPLFDDRSEADPISGFHPPPGPSDEALPLLEKLDLHDVVAALRSRHSCRIARG